MLKERRSAPRFDCSGRADIQMAGDQLPSPARIVNLSDGGCLLVFDEPHDLAQDTILELTFRINDCPFRVWGKVRAIHSETQVGFQFPLLSERVRKRLEELIEQLVEDSLIKALRGAAREKRRHPRVECMGTAGVQLAAGEPVVPAKIVNLSAGGCMMVLKKPQRLEQDLQVELSFQINNLPFRLRGQAQAIHSDTKIGFQFLQVSQRSRRQLEDVVDELIGNVVKRFTERTEVG